MSRFEDLSGERGYQFKFYCDACGAGRLSSLRPTGGGAAGTLMRAAGEFLSELVVPVATPEPTREHELSPEHEEAWRAAVTEAGDHFRQCGRCARWVCTEACWDEAAGRCRHECEHHPPATGAATPHADAGQRDDDAPATEAAHAPPRCEACGAEVGEAKFCPECGTPVQTAARPACPTCGHRPEGGPTFCPECGAKLERHL